MDGEYNPKGPCVPGIYPNLSDFGDVPEEFASYPVLQDPDLLIAIARNLDLAWTSQIVNY